MKNLQNVTVREKAYEILRDAIIKGKMPPRRRLIEDDLVKEFGVSRTPLREAIHKLEQDGLVVRCSTRGVMVAEASAKEVIELYDVRRYLESLAARRVAEQLTDEQAEVFTQFKRDADTYRARGDIEAARVSLHNAHEYLYDICDHELCMDLLLKLKAKIAKYGRISADRADRPLQAMQEHVNIIDCILSRDGEAAEAAMRQHIHNALEACIDSIKKELATQGNQDEKGRVSAKEADNGSS